MKTASSLLFLAVLVQLCQPLPLRAADVADAAAVDHAIACFTVRAQDLAKSKPDALSAILRQAFGSQLTAKAEHDLIEAAAQRALPRPGHFRFIEPALLAGAAGAYSPEDGGTVLLNSDYRDDSARLLEIVTHEWGHHLDAVLGSADARGEEGEIFQQGLSIGGPVSALAYRRLALIENHAVIKLAGRSLAVETGFFDFITKPFNKALNMAVPAVKLALSNDKNKAAAVASLAAAAKNDKKPTVIKYLEVIATASVKTIQNSASKKRPQEGVGELLVKFAREEPEFVKDLDTVAAKVTELGRAYNKAMDDLDKLSPGLGTAVNVGVTAIPIAGQVWAGYTTSSKIYTQVKAGDAKGAINTGIFEGGGLILGMFAGEIPVGKIFGAAAGKAGKAAGAVATKLETKAASTALTKAESALAEHVAEVAARKVAEEASKAAAKKVATSGTTALLTKTTAAAGITAVRTRAGAVIAKPGIFPRLSAWLASNPVKAWFLKTGVKAGVKGGIENASTNRGLWTSTNRGLWADVEATTAIDPWSSHSFAEWSLGGGGSSEPSTNLLFGHMGQVSSQPSQLQGLQLAPGGTQYNNFVSPPPSATPPVPVVPLEPVTCD